MKYQKTLAAAPELATIAACASTQCSAQAAEIERLRVALSALVAMDDTGMGITSWNEHFDNARAALEANAAWKEGAFDIPVARLMSDCRSERAPNACFTAEQIEAMRDAATPGPWVAKWSEYLDGVFIVQTTDASNRVLAEFNGDGCGPDKEEFASAALIATAPDLATIAADALRRVDAQAEEIERLKSMLSAKPWPPSDAELRSMLADVVGVWWSSSSASFIRKGQLSVNDTKAMYALRNAIEPYVFARAALEAKI